MTFNSVSDYDKAVTILKWVSGLWRHNGMNKAEKEDPLYILDRVIHHGERFRCVEYSIVINACLLAIGLESRVLYLKMKNADEMNSYAGHVGCECFLREMDKWIFVDGQWGAIPIKNGIPLSVYEFSTAISNNNKKLEINWINNVYGSTAEKYIKWIKPYLYYFDCYYVSLEGSLVHVMFVPKNAKELSAFQKTKKINVDYYIHDIRMLYN